MDASVLGDATNTVSSSGAVSIDVLGSVAATAATTTTITTYQYYY